jgi:hypothetical protein
LSVQKTGKRHSLLLREFGLFGSALSGFCSTSGIRVLLRIKTYKEEVRFSSTPKDQLSPKSKSINICIFLNNSKSQDTACGIPSVLTIVEETLFVAPSEPFSKGSSFEGYAFFEAPSIRKRGETYYFIYSSVAITELYREAAALPVRYA